MRQTNNSQLENEVGFYALRGNELVNRGREKVGRKTVALATNFRESGYQNNFPKASVEEYTERIEVLVPEEPIFELTEKMSIEEPVNTYQTNGAQNYSGAELPANERFGEAAGVAQILKFPEQHQHPELTLDVEIDQAFENIFAAGPATYNTVPLANIATIYGA